MRTEVVTELAKVPAGLEVVFAHDLVTGPREGHCRWRRAVSTRLTCGVAAWLG